MTGKIVRHNEGSIGGFYVAKCIFVNYPSTFTLGDVDTETIFDFSSHFGDQSLSMPGRGPEDIFIDDENFS